MILFAVAMGVLLAIDGGVWAFVFRHSRSPKRNWRIIDANLAVVAVNVAVIVAGQVVLVLDRLA